MLWWNWSGAKRASLFTAMLAVAAFPWVMLGWLTRQIGAFIGGTAFLLIPLIVGWFLIVGLVTGRIPTRGGSETRSASPTWFWIIAAMYAALLILFAWIICSIVADGLLHGFN